VVTDIGPVDSLVAMVMQDIGTSERLLAQGASAHGMDLRPSQARTMSQADLVIWTGPSLSPQLRQQIETLAPKAQSLPLETVEGTQLLPIRDTGLFAHDHDHDHDHDAHTDHGDEAHDPHLWLSPENAILWLDAIADALATTDPDNAATYRANAIAGAAAIAAARSEAQARLAPVADLPLGAGHDAFQYFENSFGLSVLGAITDSEASAPGPARLAALRDAFADTKPVCILTEPGTDPDLIAAIGAQGIAVVELDVLASALPQGAQLYPDLIRKLADQIATCAGT
jgi:zinc transport system substrate-binding protein